MAKKKVKIIESNITWVEKYRPKSMRDMALPKAKVGREKVELAEELTKFLKEFFKQTKNINIDIILFGMINNAVEMRFPLI